MLIKSADSNAQEIAQLEKLLVTAPTSQRSRIREHREHREHLRTLHAGIRGEKDARYFILLPIGTPCCTTFAWSTTDALHKLTIFIIHRTLHVFGLLRTFGYY